MRPDHRSTKPVKDIAEIQTNKVYVIPERFSNDYDPQTGRRCVYVQSNGVKFYIPVEKPTVIPERVYNVLRDVGIITTLSDREAVNFDPFGYEGA